MWDDTMGGGMMGMGFLWMLLLLIALVLFIVWIVRTVGSRGSTSADGSSSTDSALDLARRRYAEGEITREEFEQIKRDLR